MPQKTTAKARILIVDDEAGVRDLLFELLSERYICETTGSAEAAVSNLAARDFAAMISDVDMPDGSGLELCTRAKRIAPQIAVVLTSGNSSAGYGEKAEAAGAFRFIEKPFELADVESAVEEAVAHNRAETAKKFREAGSELPAKGSERNLRLRDYQSFGDPQLTAARCH